MKGIIQTVRILNYSLGTCEIIVGFLFSDLGVYLAGVFFVAFAHYIMPRLYRNFL